MSGPVLAVRNPRTGLTDRSIAAASADEVAATCTRLRAGQRAWQRAGVAHRARVLRRWRDLLSDDRAILAELCVDTGRRAESELEVQVVQASLARWCDHAEQDLAAGADRSGERPSSLPFVQLRGDTRPYPLVAVISPWNFPLLLSVIDTIPALLAGCAVVVKPSEITPRFIEPMQAIIERVPELAAVLHYLPGAAATGQAMVDHADLVCFTGSVATGRNIATRCGQRLIPAYLELGGKDAAIVTASADIERASAA
ncbi:MAG: aldehyde dehydrogenase family protein, partial [Myxococcota bacterium]